MHGFHNYLNTARGPSGLYGHTSCFLDTRPQPTAISNTQAFVRRGRSVMLLPGISVVGSATGGI